MKKLVSRMIALGCAGVLLFGVSGCSKSKEEEDEEKTNEKKVLTVLTERKFEQDIKTARRTLGEQRDDVEVKIEILSSEPETRETMIQKLRTQIMAGKGYDLYILDNMRYGGPENELPLFENMYKTMEGGVFASLNDEMKEDEYWQQGTYPEPFLKAGQYKGKQYVLPLSGELKLYLSNEEEEQQLGDKTLSEWMEEAKKEENPDLVWTMLQQSLFFKFWYQPAVDYENQSVLFDKELWQNFFLSYQQFWVGHKEFLTHKYAGNDIVSITNDTKQIELIPDLQGNRAACIQAFGAVGMSSEYKEEAYQFLMLCLNREGNGLEDGIKGAGDPFDEEALKWRLRSFGLNDEVVNKTMEAYSQLDTAFFATETESMLQTAVDESKQTGRWEVTEDWEKCKEAGEQIAKRALENYEKQAKE